MAKLLSTKGVNQEVDIIEDIGQCITNIVRTPKGNIPMYAYFGCDAFVYIDKPIDKVRFDLNRELKNSIKTYEPRVDVISISYTYGSLGNLIAKIKVKIKAEYITKPIVYEIDFNNGTN